jgi:DNA polymerase-3 subunit beta
MLTANRKATESALRALKAGVSRRPGLPALTGVLLEADGYRASFTSTDLEVSVRADVDAVGEPARILVPFEAFSTAVRSAGDTFTIAPNGGTVEVAGASIRLLPVEDFPKMDGEGPANVGELDAGDLVGAITAAAIAASKDEARPVLTGVLLELGETCRLVSTDSYRLHVIETAGSGSLRAIVPARALVAVAKVLGRKASGKVAVAGGEDCSDIRFSLPDGTELRSRVIEGEYPNWAQLVPEAGAGDVVMRYELAELEAALKAAGPYCGTQPVRVEFNQPAAGMVRLSAAQADLGAWVRELEHVEVTGEPVTVAFNPVYFGGAIKAAGAGATLEVRDGLKPAVVRSEDGRRTALVMPVRLPVPVE